MSRTHFYLPAVYVIIVWRGRYMAKTKKKLRIDIKIIIAAVAAIALISSIIAISSANSRSRHNENLYSFGKAVADGIDVSEHNGKIDWNKVKDEKDFAFIRVGYRGYGSGDIFEDKYARDNLKGANEAGIPAGVYFYSQAISEKEAEKEADFVHNIIKKYDIDLPVIIDFEYPIDSDGNATGRLTEAQLDKDTNTDIINAFLTRIEKKGYCSGVYASSSVFAHRINTNNLNESSILWVADYNSKVTFDVDYTVWQYSETGSCDGVSSKYVDLNYWYK